MEVVISLHFSLLFIIYIIYLEVEAFTKSSTFINDAILKLDGNLSRNQDEDKSRKMFLMATSLTDLPFGNHKIHNLNAAYNKLNSLLDFEFYNKNYTGLRKVYLQQNNIRHISHQAFRGIKHLKYLELSYNQIRKIDSRTFVTNNKLSKLIINNNLIRFEKLDTFLLSYSIEHLVLSNNKIDQVYELTFLGLPNLKSLILNNNDLYFIASNSFKSQNNFQYFAFVNTGVYRLSESMFSMIPRTLNLEKTPLSNRFEPPLKKVNGEAAIKLVGLSTILIL